MRRRRKRTADRWLATAPPPSAVPRANFAETAFWQPQLLTDADGSATIEFTVPDSVTSWNVWVHAITKTCASGSVSKRGAAVKELMVRPYVPRFLREGDQAEIKVVVNNAADTRALRRAALRASSTPTPGRACSPSSASRRPSGPARSRSAKGGGTNVDVRADGARRVGMATLQGHRDGGRPLRRRAAAAAGPAGPHAPRPVALRHAARQGQADADLRRPGEERRPDAA